LESNNNILAIGFSSGTVLLYSLKLSDKEKNNEMEQEEEKEVS
jgi:hypothetical protein